MSDSRPRSVLVAVVARSDTCTIAFCASMLKLQVQLARAKDVAVAIDFVASQDAGWAAFEAGNHDTLVLLDSHMGVSPEFVLEEPTADCVISPYPLPKLDWAKAETLLKDPACAHPEEAAFVYNVDPPAPSVPFDKVTEMRVAKFRRGAPRNPATVNVDLAHPSQCHGMVAFTGCVGHRRVLR
jgi:hypothetical protein